jgi:hypothetical protein
LIVQIINLLVLSISNISKSLITSFDSKPKLEESIINYPTISSNDPSGLLVVLKALILPEELLVLSLSRINKKLF